MSELQPRITDIGYPKFCFNVEPVLRYFIILQNKRTSQIKANLKYIGENLTEAGLGRWKKLVQRPKMPSDNTPSFRVGGS